MNAEPTETELEARRAARQKELCACCGFPKGQSKIVERIEIAKEGEKPLVESLHQACYDFVKKTVERHVGIALKNADKKPG